MTRKSSHRRYNAARPGDPVTNFTAELPWGYEPQRGVLALTDEAKPVVESVFSLAKAHKPPDEIAKTVTSKFHTLPGGKPIDKTWVASILENPAYAGVWFTVGELTSAVTPEDWLAAYGALGHKPDESLRHVVLRYGSSPETLEETRGESGLLRRFLR